MKQVWRILSALDGSRHCTRDFNTEAEAYDWINKVHSDPIGTKFFKPDCVVTKDQETTSIERAKMAIESNVDWLYFPKLKYGVPKEEHDYIKARYYHVVFLRSEGFTYKEIGKRLGIGQAMANRLYDSAYYKWKSTKRGW